MGLLKEDVSTRVLTEGMDYDSRYPVIILMLSILASCYALLNNLF